MIVTARVVENLAGAVIVSMYRGGSKGGDGQKYFSIFLVYRDLNELTLYLGRYMQLHNKKIFETNWKRRPF